MKLSEAIRLGTMLGKFQYFGGYRNYNDTATCALGAAEDAGFDVELPHPTDEADCPACGRVFHEEDPDMEYTIPHLNDDHRWTREQIAAWVETVEASQPVTADVEKART